MLDLIIAIPLAFFLYKGWRKGIIREAVALAGLIGGTYAAVHFSEWVADALKLEGPYTALVAFFITFAGVLVLTFFLGRAAEGFTKLTHTRMLNRIAGGALGMIKGICIVSIMLSTISFADPHEKLLTPEAKAHSRLYEPCYSAGSLITHSLKERIQKIESEIADTHNKDKEQ